MTGQLANTVETAYEYLRDRVVTFRVKPGERLNESEIAATLTMSRAPIREALNRLIADGLVSFEPRRGFFCRRLSISEMAELYAVRYDLESGALRQSLAAADGGAISAFVQKWRFAGAMRPSDDIDAFVTADEAFHLELAALAGNAARLKFLENINNRIRFVRRINLETRDGALDEHHDLLDAVDTRDATAAQQILRNHLDRSAEEVRDQVQQAIARIYADDVA
ncbi:GntR family transcriptional regulator [Rhodospirillaceae bacterium KN72]|uniref:GntR family transcriptional regulator n=1 Tax=Pacificispira spongiicola TaxID=2729598 RepID=A0A7Y0HEV4_9PROT|nr:GntR family transcriptional regulator [Pacificispira spongiicola]NMM43312.1 GntR family transcriptional regulator [Pacificispira spongiicola]